MSFQQRHVNQQELIKIWQTSGIQGIKKYFLAPDLLYFSQNEAWSRKIYELLLQNDEKKITEEFEECSRREDL